jgi:hypothetical protein
LNYGKRYRKSLVLSSECILNGDRSGGHGKHLPEGEEPCPYAIVVVKIIILGTVDS